MSRFNSEYSFAKNNRLARSLNQAIPSRLFSEIDRNQKIINKALDQSGFRALQKHIHENMLLEKVIPSNFFETIEYQKHLVALSQPEVVHKLDSLLIASIDIQSRLDSLSKAVDISFEKYRSIVDSLSALDSQHLVDLYENLNMGLIDLDFDQEAFSSIDPAEVEEIADELIEETMESETVRDYLGSSQTKSVDSRNQGSIDYRTEIKVYIVLRIIDMFLTPILESGSEFVGQKIAKLLNPVHHIEEVENKVEAIPYIVRVDALHLRAEPDDESDIIGLLAKDNVVTINDRDDNFIWVHISCETASGVLNGWVNGKFLQEKNVSTSD